MPADEDIPVELPPVLRARVERLVLEQATRSERALSIGRAGFCALVLLRFLFLGGGGTRAAWITVPAVVFTIAFSAALLVRAGPFSPRLFGLSSVVDAATCFAALLPNVLWPWAEYRGLLLLPDVTAILLIVSVSALRLRPRATWIAIAANLASGTLLVTLDANLNRARYEVAPEQVVLALMWLGAASFIARSLAGKGLALATQSAQASLKSAFATENLRALLAGHHDARTLLSSATLHADLLLRRLGAETRPGAGDGDDEARAIAVALRGDLAELHGFERSIKEHAWGALVADGSTEPADPTAAFASAHHVVATAFPDAKLTFTTCDADLRVLAAGGTEGLGRALLNVLVNACEGDERGRARTVDVGVRVTDEGVAIGIRDDGPGFPSAMLVAPVGRHATTKKDGSGLGLLLVRNFVEASGGALELANETPGAHVELTLPFAER